MRGLLSTDHPALRPLWVRILVVAVAVAGLWGVFEFFTGAPFWGVLFFGLAGYASWEFFLEPTGRRDGE